MSQLNNLNEPNVVRGLSLRFKANQIYTFAGPILIAINPWQVCECAVTRRTMRAYVHVRVPLCARMSHAKACVYMYTCVCHSHATHRGTDAANTLPSPSAENPPAAPVTPMHTAGRTRERSHSTSIQSSTRSATLCTLLRHAPESRTSLR